MSTAVLTIVVTLLLVIGLTVSTVKNVWLHEVALALRSAGLAFMAIHLGLMVAAWSALANYNGGVISNLLSLGSAADSPFGDMPAWASLPTWQYDLSAWIAIAFLAASGGIAMHKRARTFMERRADKVRLESVPTELTATTKTQHTAR